uniref:Uncharacterized protein n=1 Tax=Chenopodium quinoa TaxID=63459 RepID=A0A803N389_CHEQI
MRVSSESTVVFGTLGPVFSGGGIVAAIGTSSSLGDTCSSIGGSLELGEEQVEDFCDFPARFQNDSKLMLEEQANAVMRGARAEISAALNKMKKETQVEVEAKWAEGRKKIEVELQEALASLEKQKVEVELPPPPANSIELGVFLK